MSRKRRVRSASPAVAVRTRLERIRKISEDLARMPSETPGTIALADRIKRDIADLASYLKQPKP
jgi:hypothetical protein